MTLKLVNDETGTKEEPAPASDAYTDSGNARAFAALHKDKFLYEADTGTWRVWNGQRWKFAYDVELTDAAKEVAKKLLQRATRIQNDDARKAAVAWAMKTCDAYRLSAMVKLAASEPQFRAFANHFDKHFDLLNVANGTIDLSTSTLKAHDPADRITRLTPIPYEPTTPRPRWDQFAREVFDGDEELIRYVQRAVGYALTGHTKEHAFFLLYGLGQNGKGRFIRQVQRLAGDASRTTQFTTFTADRANQTGNTPELADLFGARVVVAGEPDAGVRLSESVIKSITGEDEIQACRKYENPFSFTPQFKVLLHTNYKPEIRGIDDGIWRRVRLIPFTVSFKGRADKELDAKLDAEGSGILAWAVEGARHWYTEGLGTCAAVTGATSGYREESDILAPFFKDRTTVHASSFTPGAEIYAAYKSWAEKNGMEPMKQQTLTKQLRQRGWKVDKYNGVRGVIDMLLK